MRGRTLMLSRFWRWFLGSTSPSWTQQIQVLKAETPLDLPAIKPLQAKREQKPFIEDHPVTPWPENVTPFARKRSA